VHEPSSPPRSLRSPRSVRRRDPKARAGRLTSSHNHTRRRLVTLRPRLSAGDDAALVLASGPSLRAVTARGADGAERLNAGVRAACVGAVEVAAARPRPASHW
jgi:hypothetical protein